MRKIFITITALILFASCENTDELKSVNSNKSNLTKNEKVIRELLDGFRSEKILYNGKYYTLKDSSIFEKLVSLNLDKEYFFIIADPYDLHKFELTNKNMYVSTKDSKPNITENNFTEKTPQQTTSKNCIIPVGSQASRLKLFEHANYQGYWTNCFTHQYFKGNCCNAYNKYYEGGPPINGITVTRAYAMPFLNFFREYRCDGCIIDFSNTGSSSLQNWGLHDSSSSLQFRLGNTKPDVVCRLFLYIDAFHNNYNCISYPVPGGQGVYTLPNAAVMYNFTGGRDYAIRYFAGFNDSVSSYLYYFE